MPLRWRRSLSVTAIFCKVQDMLVGCLDEIASSVSILFIPNEVFVFSTPARPLFMGMPLSWESGIPRLLDDLIVSEILFSYVLGCDDMMVLILELKFSKSE